jgi:site-specific recombinase XerD
MNKLRIQSARHGPHSLRHACATHLLSERFSLKEIGDHLGHHSTTATQVYAKVNLAALREVADLDLEFLSLINDPVKKLEGVLS